MYCHRLHHAISTETRAYVFVVLDAVRLSHQDEANGGGEGQQDAGHASVAFLVLFTFLCR